MNMFSCKEQTCVTRKQCCGLSMKCVLELDDQLVDLITEKQLYHDSSDLINGLFRPINSNTLHEFLVWLFKVNYLPFMGNCFHMQLKDAD